MRKGVYSNLVLRGVVGRGGVEGVCNSTLSLSNGKLVKISLAVLEKICTALIEMLD